MEKSFFFYKCQSLTVNGILSCVLNKLHNLFVIVGGDRYKLNTSPSKINSFSLEYLKLISSLDRFRLDNIPFGGFPKVEKHKLPARKKSYFSRAYELKAS